MRSAFFNKQRTRRAQGEDGENTNGSNGGGKPQPSAMTRRRKVQERS